MVIIIPVQARVLNPKEAFYLCSLTECYKGKIQNLEHCIVIITEANYIDLNIAIITL